MIHPIARIRQQPRYIRHRRFVRVPVERGLALKSRGVRQGARVDDLGLIRCVTDGPIPIPTVIACTPSQRYVGRGKNLPAEIIPVQYDKMVL